VKARENDARDVATAAIVERLDAGLAHLPPWLEVAPDAVIERLSRSG
jgi:hypothetical protein